MIQKYRFTVIGIMIIISFSINLFSWLNFNSIADASGSDCKVTSGQFNSGPYAISGKNTEVEIDVNFIVECNDTDLLEYIEKAEFGVFISANTDFSRPIGVETEKQKVVDFSKVSLNTWATTVTLRQTGDFWTYLFPTEEVSGQHYYGQIDKLYLYPFVFGSGSNFRFTNNSMEVPVNKPGQTPPATGEFKPLNVAVCKLSLTSARIFWDTVGATNSALEYSLWGEDPTADQKKVAGTALKNHSITLSGLTKGENYGYAIYVPKQGSKVSTVDSHDVDEIRSLIAGETNDERCNTDGTVKPAPPTNTNTNTPTGNPNSNINTSVGVSLGNLDESLGSFFNPLTAKTVPEIIGTILRILFVLIGIAAVVVIIVSGFRMVIASGNEVQLTLAKKSITWAIIGLIVSLMAFSIVAIVQRLIEVGK
jgi:hypothetical protein